MKKIAYLFMFILLFITVACEQTLENEEINFSETNMQKDWTVNAYIDDILIFGPFTISTPQKYLSLSFISQYVQTFF